MLWIVKTALRRPYTFVVMALLILLAGPLAILRTPTDIFPDIRIPVISAVWSYNGLSPDDMAGRIVYYYERSLSSTVNDIEHIESQSLNGVGVVKIFFQPGVDIRTATAQVTSLSQTVLKQMPAGITPPLILNYNASTVPILQLAMSGEGLSEQKIFDFGQNFIRPALASVPGSAIPSPYGGKVRQVMISLDPQALSAKGLSAEDVAAALAAQNQVTPVGLVKIGMYQYNVKLNNSNTTVDELNDLPIKSVNGALIYMRDVAHVSDGNAPQTNIVRVDGSRAVLMTILKSGSASTLAIINGVKQMLPSLKDSLPDSLKISTLGDQSLFVTAAISGVVREAIIAALLTSCMILLFLGSWRSTLIITLSIPLAILGSIIALSATGETLNIMTLGGLALAVGILVDDATVTIENINWHLEHGKPVQRAIMDGAQQIVVPAFVSLLCICIVFVPMFYLGGVSGFLFVPMAKAVIFAMISSFILSRTLVPTVANYLLKAHDSHAEPSQNLLARFQRGFEQRFENIRHRFQGLLVTALAFPRQFVVGFLAVVLCSFLLVPSLGRNFFPDIDGGQMTLHVRAPVGTRVEETAALFDHIEAAIRRTLPRGEVVNIVDNIGLTVSGINMAYSNTGTVGPQDGDIMVTLREGHAPTADHVRRLREVLPREFPGTSFAFLPADIISQILNFGHPAPLDIRISGKDARANAMYANEVLERLQHVSGLVDARIQQATNYPELHVTVDRSRARLLGITEHDVTTSLGIMLAGSFQSAPTFWLNPKNGVSYPIVAQTPEYLLQSSSDLANIPLTSPGSPDAHILGAISTITREPSNSVVSHYAIKPSIDIYATLQGRDLGAVSNDIYQVLDDTRKDLPKGSTAVLTGQVDTMHEAFTGLGLGLLAAIVLIYLLIVVNFQSWLDPFVIITALPAALAGIVWMLFITNTPLSVPALTGAIMCMGVATANSILVVSFARERLAVTGNALQAAIESAYTRFRPVLMTALAMIIGMAPMALGLGEGGEQNAPLGRAVIGGLSCATIATLFFVPVVFSLVHRHDKIETTPSESDDASAGETHVH